MWSCAPAVYQTWRISVLMLFISLRLSQQDQVMNVSNFHGIQRKLLQEGIWSFRPHMSQYCLDMYKKDKTKRNKAKKPTSSTKCKTSPAKNDVNCYRGECPKGRECFCCPPIIDEYIEKYEGDLQGPTGGWTGVNCNTWIALADLVEMEEYKRWLNEIAIAEFDQVDQDKVDILEIIKLDGDERNYEPRKSDGEKECKTTKSTCYRGLCQDRKCDSCFEYDGAEGLAGKYHGEHCDVFIPDAWYDQDILINRCQPPDTYEASDCQNPGSYCNKVGLCVCGKVALGVKCETQILQKKFCPNKCHKKLKQGKCKKWLGKYRCQCKPGFDGVGCERKFNCSLSGFDLCVHGTCEKTTVRGVRTEICKCTEGLQLVPPYCRADTDSFCGKSKTKCEGEGSTCVVPKKKTAYCDCGPGRKRPGCSEKCDPDSGTFGRNCEQSCITLNHQCKHGPEKCSIVDGHCKACTQYFRGRFCNQTVYQAKALQAVVALGAARAARRSTSVSDEEILQRLKDTSSALSETLQSNLQELMTKIAAKQNISTVHLDIKHYELGSIVATFDVEFPADEVGETNLNEMVETGLVEEAEGFDPGLGEEYRILKDSIKTSEVVLRTVSRDDDTSSNASLIGGVVAAVGCVAVVALVVIKTISSQKSVDQKKKGKKAGHKKIKYDTKATELGADIDDVTHKKSALTKKTKSKSKKRQAVSSEA